jgi:hypothetical protein
MATFWTKLNFIPVAALLAGCSIVASAQVTCTASGGGPSLSRSEGNTELLSDIVITCTGGIPTVAGDPVPQMNFEVALNTNATSKITYGAAFNFNEALLLVDEPNRGVPPASVYLPGFPLLNCGQTGAPDKGVSGPGVCSIISTGDPTQTYDGTPSVGPAALCTVPGIAIIFTNAYGCGRPNAYQGRMGSGSNEVDFLGVPFDPSGTGTRTFRITNLRADAAIFGPTPTPILATIVITGNVALTLTPQQVQIGFAERGMNASLAPATTETVRVTEGFASSWKARNVANTLTNAAWSGVNYVYVSPDQNDPAQAAQNVPGVLYNAEDGFQWQNNVANAPPSPDPPVGYQISGTTPNLKFPLNSVAYGGIDTGINADGVSSAGTRIALTFRTLLPSPMMIPPTVTVPSVVYLHPVASPATTSGVMVLTSTDAAGAGPFTPGAPTTIPNGGMAVYEVLYSDPFSLEYADVDCSVSSFIAWGTQTTVNLAPFYTTSSAGFATPTVANPMPTAIPRFSTANSVKVTITAP